MLALAAMIFDRLQTSNKEAVGAPLCAAYTVLSFPYRMLGLCQRGISEQAAPSSNRLVMEVYCPFRSSPLLLLLLSLPGLEKEEEVCSEKSMVDNSVTLAYLLLYSTLPHPLHPFSKQEWEDQR